MICQSECPWPGPLVHLSQHSGSFLQPCVDRSTEPDNLPATMFFAAKEGDSDFFLCLGSEQSVLTATGCHKEAHLDFDQMIVFILSTQRHQDAKYCASIYTCVYAHSWFILRQTLRETTSVTSYFIHWFHSDPEARHIGHFDSKLYRSGP